MAAILAIVGCGPRLESALQAPGMAAPGVVALAGPVPRSELVMSAVDLLLRAAGLERASLGLVLATRGPGSFTGVRVALATAGGLAAALGIPAVGVPSLLAQAARCAGERCLAVQPARRGQVYAQTFRRLADGWQAEDEPCVLPLSELAAARDPVVAPAGLELPPGARAAAACTTTAEALLALAPLVPTVGLDTLAPLYLEPPPAVPPTRTAKPWPPSPPAT
ncbi:MAG TPA: tRNA (adenosine(37)-N6)-threonylcarbamoyltransferase complex dimerization subunit type 1 TsaB [Thermoanaerobaculaceae bacterium]|nr:tRNA (adenosine(37)-N6)-threonylcarbamoyltransferase complex dimerization subunit type 1 TsaB [Thermoanaerobaculaceae bacterium]HRS15759.1 tRNA (adenosine(37)-N6)-threonylcarbamoyltransferase complex dimerization subunit type 1 TsaB [Thermoanaerobaculaceae bacterium]